MRRWINVAAAAAALCASAAYAQAPQQGAKTRPPGPGGAESNVFNDGIARDPSEVQAQQGGSSKASPGTVGAAPGADTPSQRAR